MDVTALLDPTGAVIVLGGTLLATCVGSGRRELAAALRCAGQLFIRPFRFETARAEIARDVEELRVDGVLRSGPFHSSDSEIATATRAMIRDRSLASLIAAHERFRTQRTRLRALALRPIRLAAEMAPVFGMAGTLFALSQMDHDPAAGGLIMDGIGIAIVTTLYGLMLAHLVLHPLASLIARRGAAEEEERQMLIDWMTRQLSGTVPPSAPRQGEHASPLPRARTRLERVV
ncbi:MotA/TolQ/ExbB proton channel family protein [Altererythrobacter lauratis]|uniref:MotA/TolQ/ExbB proton channel family protein n=1 Tax=Alteraurantiacibacter lauratis TaxID=2054627 RepID=A0ABV7EB93_9SPHN